MFGKLKKTPGSLFFKLVTTYSLIIVLSMSITFYIRTARYVDILQADELRLERTAMNQLTQFTKNSYQKLFNIVLQAYNTKQLMEGIRMVNADRTQANAPMVSESITYYLNTICNTSSEVTDFIVVTKNYTGFYGNAGNTMNRSLSVSHDFSTDRLIRELQDSKANRLISDDPSRYMTIPDKKMVTFAGNFFDIQALPRKESIGYFIINIPLDAFRRSYQDLTGDLNGDLLLVNSKGQILYSSEEQLVGQTYAYFDKVKNAGGQEMLLDKPCFVNTAYIKDADLTVINTLPKDFVWEKLQGLQREMITILLVSLLVTVAMTALISNVFRVRIKTLMSYMKRVQKGELDISIPVKSRDELGQLSVIFNDMCRKLNDYINQVYFAEISRKSSELAALQSQINPHFLYNTLESIHMKAVEENQPEIASMISTLGSLFRWSVKMKDKFVRIEDEIDYVTSYLELQKFRFGELLELNINIAEEILDLGIPKLLLQPIVENAVVHGIGPVDGTRCVGIDGAMKEGVVEIIVMDNGRGMDDEEIVKLTGSMEKSEDDSNYYRIGLKNVHQRIRLIFGNDYGVSIKSEKGVGTAVSVRIPAGTIKELDQNGWSDDRR